MLTEDEHAVIEKAADLWNHVVKVVRGLDEDGAPMLDELRDDHVADGDLRELIPHIHAIQRAMMGQAAARLYPDRYRRLGCRLPKETP